MDFFEFSRINTNQVLQTLKSSEAGLTLSEAKNRLVQYGFNELETREFSMWQILLRQFKSSFVYLLLAAAIVSFVLKEYLDGSMILGFIFINAVLGFFQEARSEQTIQLLKKYVQSKVRVLRSSKEEIILSRELVPGDIVVIETGDVVPADMRIIKSSGLTIDESVLTGESNQTEKIPDTIDLPKNDIYKAKNIVFMGSTVVFGTATAVVVKTAKLTEVGKISKLTSEVSRESGFEKQINRFSKVIMYIVLGTLALVLLAHLFLKPGVIPIPDLAIFAIAMAVGVVPEAMPLVTTFSLSNGARILAKKKVVVKRLSAIEDLGSIEVLCSDKTGTLTENKMEIADFLGEKPNDAVFFGALASSVQTRKNKLANNSFDLAFFNKLTKDQNQELLGYKRVFEIPFDPTRRRNSVLVESAGQKLLIVRGAPETMLPYLENTSKEQVENQLNWCAEQGRLGKRTMAIAAKYPIQSSTYTIDDEKNGLKLMGIVAFVDPVKATTLDSVKKAEELKVIIKILTGDAKEVAGAVAFKVGIAADSSHVITGEEFETLDADKQVEVANTYNVFARVSPEQKYKIIQVLQQTYRVGYLGEGINDAPALKIADVALAVDGAADIAREASDIVLLDSNLEVIVNGIEEGRKTFVNTMKYIKSTMASNFGNFYAMAAASLMIPYLPMLPLQILLVNLLSDFPMISIASDTVEPDELKSPKSYQIKDILVLATILGLVSTLFDFIFFGVFSRMGPQKLQTNWFIGSILTELALIFSIRTRKIFFKATTFPSIIMTVLTFVAAFLTLTIPLSIWGEKFFGFIRPSGQDLSLIFVIVVMYFVTTEVAKLGYFRFAKEENLSKR